MKCYSHLGRLHEVVNLRSQKSYNYTKDSLMMLPFSVLEFNMIENILILCDLNYDLICQVLIKFDCASLKWHERNNLLGFTQLMNVVAFC